MVTCGVPVTSWRRGPSELLHHAVSGPSSPDTKAGPARDWSTSGSPTGPTYIVKRVTPASDLTLALTGGTVAREYLLWRSGALDRLPPGVDHAVVDGWVEGDTTVIVMDDLGDQVLTWESWLSTDETDWVVARVAAMHRRFLGSPPQEVVPLDRVLTVFAPQRIRGLADEGNELAGLACRGWEIFAQTVPADVAGPVLVLLEDPTRLVTALGAGPVTLAHGDLATVNMARDDDRWCCSTGRWRPRRPAPWTSPGSSPAAPRCSSRAARTSWRRTPAWPGRRTTSARCGSPCSPASVAGLEQGAGRGRAPRSRHAGAGAPGPRLVGP